jgi:hypothetical protein
VELDSLNNNTALFRHEDTLTVVEQGIENDNWNHEDCCLAGRREPEHPEPRQSNFPASPKKKKKSFNNSTRVSYQPTLQSIDVRLIKLPAL